MSEHQFSQNKEESLSHQVIKLGRLINTVGLSAVRKKFSMPGLTQAHLDLFPYIDFTGTPIKTMAAKKEVSKQAISKLVNEMVELGLLYFKENPEDARSKLVCFYTKGPRSIDKGFLELVKIDMSLRVVIGERSYISTTKSLGRLIAYFEK